MLFLINEGSLYFITTNLSSEDKDDESLGNEQLLKQLLKTHKEYTHICEESESAIWNAQKHVMINN